MFSNNIIICNFDMKMSYGWVSIRKLRGVAWRGVAWRGVPYISFHFHDLMSLSLSSKINMHFFMFVPGKSTRGHTLSIGFVTYTVIKGYRND